MCSIAFLRNFLAAAVIVLSASPAFAELSYVAEQTPDGLSYVLISGDISYEDNLDEFADVVRAHNVSIVSFNSPGGNVTKAMELGRLIRAFRLDTLQIRDLDCSSACALAFMGGVERVAEPGAIGVHKSSFGPNAPISADDAVSAVQQLTAEVISYMVEMGVDPALLQLSLKYEQDDIRYLALSEMEHYRVVTTGEIASPPIASSPAPQAYPPPSASDAPSASAAVRPSRAMPTARTGRVLHPKGGVPLKLLAEGDSRDIATLRNGHAVSILGSHERWYKVRSGVSTGYLHHTWVHVDQYESGPFGQRHIQIASFSDLANSTAFVQSINLPLSAYLATNGWFAITIAGTFSQDRARLLLDNLKGSGSIPDDSFTTFGTTYVRKVCCD